MKEIRLVRNKLFPMPSISRRIEDFANEKLNSFLEVIPAVESSTTEMPTPKAHKKDGGLIKLPSSVVDAQILMSLYFSLCTEPSSLSILFRHRRLSPLGHGCPVGKKPSQPTRCRRIPPLLPPIHLPTLILMEDKGGLIISMFLSHT